MQHALLVVVGLRERDSLPRGPHLRLPGGRLRRLRLRLGCLSNELHERRRLRVERGVRRGHLPTMHRNRRALLESDELHGPGLQRHCADLHRGRDLLHGLRLQPDPMQGDGRLHLDFAALRRRHDL
jgi:hypothetical protein